MRVRNKSGNMLVIVCVTMAVVALMMLALSSFGMIFFVKNRLQTAADEIALAGAKKLNEHDRIGQMNNMLARSRQLVFNSRQQHDKISTEYLHLQEIANGQMEDSKEAAQLLEAERVKLLADAKNDAIIAMKAKFDSIKDSFPMVLPWAQIGAPVLNDGDIKLGKMAEVESNVIEMGRTESSTLSDCEELVNHDRGNTFVKVWPHVQLYRAETPTEAKLPGDDADLNYKISSLTPPVDGTVSPARVVLARNYTSVKDGFVPSATQVKISLTIGTGLGAAASEVLSAVGTAVTTGADEQQ